MCRTTSGMGSPAAVQALEEPELHEHHGSGSDRACTIINRPRTVPINKLEKSRTAVHDSDGGGGGINFLITPLSGGSPRAPRLEIK